MVPNTAINPDNGGNNKHRNEDTTPSPSPLSPMPSRKRTRTPATATARGDEESSNWTNNHNHNNRNDHNNHNNNPNYTDGMTAAASTNATPSIASSSHSEMTCTTTDDDGNNSSSANSLTMTTATAAAAAPHLTDTDINIDIDDLTQQMGKLWWPTSNQDLIKIYERDKYGRLVTSDQGGKRKASGGNNKKKKCHNNYNNYSNSNSNSNNDAFGSASDWSDTTGWLSGNNDGEGGQPVGPAVGGGANGNSNSNGDRENGDAAAVADGTPPSTIEWYDKWIESAQSATINLVGHFRTVGRAKRKRDKSAGGAGTQQQQQQQQHFADAHHHHHHQQPGHVGYDKDVDDDDDDHHYNNNNNDDDDDDDDDGVDFEKIHPKLRTSMALANSMDKFWSREMYEMDAREREDILNEIHGIPNRRKNRTLRETPESVAAAVGAFRKHLEDTLDDEVDNGDSIVPPVTKDAYRRAVFHLRSGYVLSKDFLIKFLRISNYDTPSATQRYFRYLDLLMLLFGDTALTRPLALWDLTKREMRYLKKGQMQLLPSRDRAGRRIFAFSGIDDTSFNIREKYRCNIYLIDVLSDDERTQKLGAVSLNAPRVRPRDTTHPFGFEGMTLRMGKQELLGGQCTESQFFRKINEAVPIRFSAIHYFAPQTIIYNIGKAIILALLGRDHRKIVRFHAGSQLECNYSLRSFGIPHEDITITEGNNIKTKNIQRFLNARKTIEAHRERVQKKRERGGRGGGDGDDEPPVGIECPGVDCVVYGDKTMHGLPANVEFRELLRVRERQREELLAQQGTAATTNNNNNSSSSNNNAGGGAAAAAAVPPIKEFIEEIIETARSKLKLRFLVFDKNSHLFVDITDHQELCKRVSQALRDQRKRARIEEQRNQQQQQQQQQQQRSGSPASAAGAHSNNNNNMTTTTTTNASNSASPAAMRMRGGSAAAAMTSSSPLSSSSPPSVSPSSMMIGSGISAGGFGAMTNNDSVGGAGFGSSSPSLAAAGASILGLNPNQMRRFPSSVGGGGGGGVGGILQGPGGGSNAARSGGYGGNVTMADTAGCFFCLGDP